MSAGAVEEGVEVIAFSGEGGLRELSAYCKARRGECMAKCGVSDGERTFAKGGGFGLGVFGRNARGSSIFLVGNGGVWAIVGNAGQTKADQ